MPLQFAHAGDFHLDEDRYFSDTARCVEWFVVDAIQARRLERHLFQSGNSRLPMGRKELSWDTIPTPLRCFAPRNFAAWSSVTAINASSALSRTPARALDGPP